jgi:hypothetical protein
MSELREEIRKKIADYEMRLKEKLRGREKPRLRVAGGMITLCSMQSMKSFFSRIAPPRSQRRIEAGIIFVRGLHLPGVFFDTNFDRLMV